VKRAAPLATLNLRLGLSCLGERGLTGHRDERVQHRVEPLNTREAGLRQLHRRYPSSTDLLGSFLDTQAGDISARALPCGGGGAACQRSRSTCEGDREEGSSVHVLPCGPAGSQGHAAGQADFTPYTVRARHFYGAIRGPSPSGNDGSWSEVRMMNWRDAAGAVLILFVTTVPSPAQTGVPLAELTALKDKVGNADTRVRVEALHRVWSIALASPDSQVKLTAIGLLVEPVGSSSDHIRMPAVYAIAEIANSSDDVQVKTRALTSLAEPLQAGQVPIRDVAIDAVNSITRSGKSGPVSLAAVTALAPAVRSGNNGVRIPAINAVVRAVEGSGNTAAYQAAIDLLAAPLESNAAIGGMEVRMMAVAAMEKVGLDAMDVSTKAKTMGLLQAYAARGNFEPEARKRAQEAAARIEASLKKP
jgi:hypothetical protein